jgi:hypothetical protein
MSSVHCFRHYKVPACFLVVIFGSWVDVLKIVPFHDVWGRLCLQFVMRTYRLMTVSCIILIGYLTTLSMSGPCSVGGRMINERGAVGGMKIGKERERCNGLWMTKYICVEKCSCCGMLSLSKLQQETAAECVYIHVQSSVCIQCRLNGAGQDYQFVVWIW